MTLSEAFEDHLKLAVRFRAGTPLRANTTDAPSAPRLASELDLLERREAFLQRRPEGFGEAQYAVYALIDSIVDENQQQSQLWTRLNSDPHVGHNFYTQMLVAGDSMSGARSQLLEIYTLCTLLGFPKDNGRQERVNRIIEEVIRASDRTEPLSGWPSALPAGNDPEIQSAQRLFQLAVIAGLCIFSICFIYLYGIAWIGFP